MTDLFSDREWFAIVAKPREQQRAKEYLERQDYRAFLPMCLEERTRQGRKESVRRPLFGRYVFVGIHSEQPFRLIATTPGVAFIVRGAGGIPCRVPALALREVKRRCDFDGGAVNLIPGPRTAQWQPEQSLKVLAGPFRDFIGQFAGGSGETAQILLDIFGRATVVTVDANNLQPAGTSDLQEGKRPSC